MLSPQALLKGLASRVLPPPNPDSQSNDTPIRLGRYGDVLDPIFNKYKLADEGAYFTATMTPGQTALVYGVQAAFADAAGFIAYQNTDSPIGQGTGKRIYLDYVRFIISVAPASATAAWLATKIDSANRTPSANSSVITPQNVNMDSAVGSIAKIAFPSGGTLTLPAVGGAARLVTGNLNLRNVIPAINDEYTIYFGPTDFTQLLPVAEATTAAKQSFAAPPMVVGPGQFGLLHLWFPGNAVTAASFSSIDVGWFER